MPCFVSIGSAEGYKRGFRRAANGELGNGQSLRALPPRDEALLGRRVQVAAVAEDLKIGLVVRTSNAPVRPPQRDDVIDLQAKLMTGESLARHGVSSDLAWLEAAALALPFRAPARPAPGI